MPTPRVESVTAREGVGVGLGVGGGGGDQDTQQLLNSIQESLKISLKFSNKEIQQHAYSKLQVN